MRAAPGVKISPDFPVPDTMKAWVLGHPGYVSLTDKPVPVPKRAEVLVRIDAVAICATDLEIIWHGPPASIEGGESVVVTGPGPIGLLGVAVAKALGAQPVILTGTRDNRLKTGLELGADHVVNVKNEDAVEAVRRLNGGKGVDYVVECSGAPNAVNEAIRMVNRGGKVCLAAFPHEQVPVDIAHIVRNNIYLYGIRGEGKSATHRAEAFMSQKRFDATKIHTHTFPLEDLPTALKYARERIEDAIKVVVKARGVATRKMAAE